MRAEEIVARMMRPIVRFGASAEWRAKWAEFNAEMITLAKHASSTQRRRALFALKATNRGAHYGNSKFDVAICGCMIASELGGEYCTFDIGEVDCIYCLQFLVGLKRDLNDL